MLYLPEEVWLMISKYLSVKDLASLCATDQACHDMFNRDVFWRSHVDADLAEYLATTECLVEPGFVSPEVEDSGLSNICELRLGYMRQNHLYNNWRQGRCNVFEITSMEPKDTVDCLCYGNDLVVLLNFPSQGLGYIYTVQLWDIKRDPIFISEMDIHLAKDQDGAQTEDYVYIKMYADLLVIWDTDIVYILNISSKLRTMQFQHAFYFHQGMKSFSNLTSLLPIPANLNHTEATLTSSTFLGSNMDEIMHIWDVETGEKIREETYGDCYFVKIYKNSASQDVETVIVVANQDLLHKVVIYDVTQLAFKPFVLPTHGIPYDCKLCRQVIAVNGPCGSIDLYNVDTSQLLNTFYPATANSTIFTTLGSRIIFLDSVGLCQFNTSNGKVEYIWETINGIHHKVFCDNLIVFYKQFSYFGFVINERTKFPLKDKNFSFIEYNWFFPLCSNKLCSKTFLKDCNKTKLVHFW